MSAVLKLDSHGRLPYDHEPHYIPEVQNPNYLTLKEEFAKANGCTKLLGSGSYGRVYAFPNSDDVLKVCTTGDIARDGYHGYLKIIHDLQGNPFIPRLDHFVKFHAGKDHYSNDVILYGVRMEQLFPLYSTPSTVIDKMGHDLFKGFTADMYYEQINPYTAFIRAIRASITLNPKNALNDDLYKVVDAIGDVKRKGGYCDDIGESNIMFRHTIDWDRLHVHYQLVITDPIA